MGEFSVCLSVQLAEMLFLGQLVTTAFLLNFVFVEGQGQVNLGDLIGAFLELIDDSGGYAPPSDYSRASSAPALPDPDITWVNAPRNGQIPRGRGAVKIDGDYLVRAGHDGGFYPGTYLPEEGAVDIAVGGEVLSKSQFQYAVANYDVEEGHLKWETFACAYTIYEEDRTENIDPTPFPVGQDRYGKPKFMCRLRYNGRVILGEYTGNMIWDYDEKDKNLCTLPVGDKAISVPWSGYGLPYFYGGWDLLVLDQSSIEERATESCPAVDVEGIEFVSPIAAVESYRIRGQGCPQNAPCVVKGRCNRAIKRNGFPSCRRRRE